MIKCNNCGKCCILFDRNKQKWVICPYRDPVEKKCKIYPHRIGTYLGNGFVCNYRANTPFDFPDCPYNTNKPIHPAYVDWKKDSNYKYNWCISRRSD